MELDEAMLREAELCARELAAEWSYQRDDARKRGDRGAAEILDNRAQWAAAVAAGVQRLAEGPAPYVGRRRRRARAMLLQLLAMLDETGPARAADSTPRAVS